MAQYSWRGTLALALLIGLAVTSPTAFADKATQIFAEGRDAYELGEYDKALDLWKRAAALSHAEAEFRLGAMYEEGIGVDPDLSAALDWYRRAAEHGSQQAQFNLGHMYAKGQGVEKDEARAAHWYERAAERGNAYAQYTLGLLYLHGRGVERDLALAYAWLTVAIHNFNPNMFRDNANEERAKAEEMMSSAERQRAQEILDEWEAARD